MANDIVVTPGTGTTIATDETGGHHYQLAKLVDGTENSEARIPGDATNGLYVQVKQSVRNSGNVADVTSTDLHAPAANTIASISLVGAAGVRHCITGLAWSYSGAPTNGNLKIEAGATTYFSIDIVAAGPGIITFPVAKKFADNTSVVISLAAGGAGITGKVNILNRWYEST